MPAARPPKRQSELLHSHLRNIFLSYHPPLSFTPYLLNTTNPLVTSVASSITVKLPSVAGLLLYYGPVHPLGAQSQSFNAWVFPHIFLHYVEQLAEINKKFFLSSMSTLTCKHPRHSLGSTSTHTMQTRQAFPPRYDVNMLFIAYGTDNAAVKQKVDRDEWIALVGRLCTVCILVGSSAGIVLL